MRCTDCGLPLDGSAGVPCTCAFGFFGDADQPLSPSPEQEQAFLDSQQPRSPYAQPGFWIDVFGRAIQPQQRQQQIVYMQEPVPEWVWWGLGAAAFIVLIKFLK